MLGGVLSPLDNVGPDDIKIERLISRVKNDKIEEVIIAISPTTEGDATGIYIEDLLKPLRIKVTHIATGIPVGGDLSITDSLTLEKAMEGRR